MSIERRDDWQARLRAVANEHRSLPYRYGSNDCWCFVRAAIEAMTGTLLAPNMNRYSSWLGAAKVMIENDWSTMEDVMNDLLGRSVEPAESTPGDVVSYEAGSEIHLAMRMEEEAIGPSHSGMLVVNRTFWRRAWRVG